jgi:hypothetical protein
MGRLRLFDEIFHFSTPEAVIIRFIFELGWLGDEDTASQQEGGVKVGYKHRPRLE